MDFTTSEDDEELDRISSCASFTSTDVLDGILLALQIYHDQHLGSRLLDDKVRELARRRIFLCLIFVLTSDSKHVLPSKTSRQLKDIECWERCRSARSIPRSL